MNISISTTDDNGIAHLLSNSLVDIRFVDISESAFANPDSAYTGYAADGFWRTAGVPKPLLAHFKSTWAEEGESAASTHRGDLDRFPDRIFIVTTAAEVVIFNADDLTVWMRFIPLAGAGAGNGAFLGDSDTTIQSADFTEGVLVVGTSEGLRIADFRLDKCYFLGATAAWECEDYSSTLGTGVIDRNTDTVLDFLDITATGSSNNKVVQADCTHVHVRRYATTMLCAVAHPQGISGIQIPTTGPVVEEHNFRVDADVAPENYQGGYAFDDNDADATTPYIKHTGANWEGDQVLVGDVIVTSASASHTITKVESDKLTVTPEIDLAELDIDYDIFRPCRRTYIDATGYLYFLNGLQKVSRASPSAWYQTPDENAPGSYDGIDPFAFSTNTGTAESAVTDANDLEVSGSGNVFVATDLGVFYISATDLIANKNMALFYSTTGATHNILQGGFKDCAALVLDPETGHLMVGANSGGDTVLTEIDMNLHQAFRSFDSTDVTGPTNALVAYRNTKGPPDVEL